MNPASLKKRFLNMSIRRKLLLIVLATSVSVMVVTAVVFYMEDMLAFHRHEVENRRTLADIICRNNRQAIAHNDRVYAAETLRSLAGDPHIVSAWIVLRSGEVFASYVRQPGKGGLQTVETGGRVMVAPGALSEGTGSFSGVYDSIKIAFSCTDEGNQGCTTVIVSDTDELKSRMAGYLLLVLLVLLGTSVLGYLVIFRLQRIITDPLITLVETMEVIRSKRDYRLRVPKGSSDEIGQLSDYFNRMLEEVELHSVQLHASQAKLTELIAIRTEELLQAKEHAESNATAMAGGDPVSVGNAPQPDHGVQDAGELIPDEDFRLYALIDCIDGEVWFLDAASGMVTANRAAAKTLAVDFADYIDREALVEGFEIYHFDFQCIKDEIVQSVWTIAGASIRRMEVALLTGEEPQCFQLLNAEPYRNREGELAGTVFVATDTTAQKVASTSMRSLSSRLIEGEEALRKSLSSELHDEIGRDLAALHIYYEAIRSSLSADVRQQLDDKLSFVDTLIDDMSCKVANIISELRPPQLDDFGLVPALQSFAKMVSHRYQVEVDLLVADGFPRLGSVELPLYRIAQEATNNAVKHSGAQTVYVSLEDDGATVTLVIADNGCGFDPDGQREAVKRPSWGLTIMRERAETIGGRFSLRTIPGEGTTITVQVERKLCQ